MKHIEFAQLVDRFESGLAIPDPILSHLAECRPCEAEYRKLEEFFGYVRQNALEEVPQVATANILNIYQRRPEVAKTKTSVLSKLGVLIFDDWTTALNQRYAGLDSRQLLYQADGFDIDLRVELSGDRCRVAGQIFPDCIGAAITLSKDGVAATIALNHTCEFAFDAVETGDYSLRIQSSEIDITIENIPLHI